MGVGEASEHGVAGQGGGGSPLMERSVSAWTARPQPVRSLRQGFLRGDCLEGTGEASACVTTAARNSNSITKTPADEAPTRLPRLNPSVPFPPGAGKLCSDPHPLELTLWPLTSHAGSGSSGPPRALSPALRAAGRPLVHAWANQDLCSSPCCTPTSLQATSKGPSQEQVYPEGSEAP